MFEELFEAASQRTMGININDDTHPWTKLILDGKKTIETRNGPSLRPYVGRRVGIIRTGAKKKAMLVGYMTITREIEYSSPEQFNADVDKHHVASDSTLYNGGKKYGYVVKDVKRVDPRPVDYRGIVARQIDDEQ